MRRLYCYLTVKKEKMMEAWKDETGASVIEVAVIIIILVGIAITFKGNLESFLASVVTKMNNSIGTL